MVCARQARYDRRRRTRVRLIIEVRDQRPRSCDRVPTLVLPRGVPYRKPTA